MQTVIKINQDKLLKKYKKKLKDCEKEKSDLKQDFALKVKDIEIEILEVITKLKSLQVRTANEKISKKKVFDYIHIVLDTLKLEVNSLGEKI